MIKKLFVLMNHEMLPSQISQAHEVLGIEKIISLNDTNWSSFDPDVSSIINALASYKSRLLKEASRGDYLLVQGDFGATYHMVCFAKKLGLTPLYATTKRVATQKMVDGSVVTQREFLHVRFREYEDA